MWDLRLKVFKPSVCPVHTEELTATPALKTEYILLIICRLPTF